MSSHKNIIFFVKDETHEDVSRLYNIIQSNGKLRSSSDDREYWSETYRWVNQVYVGFAKQLTLNTMD